MLIYVLNESQKKGTERISEEIMNKNYPKFTSQSMYIHINTHTHFNRYTLECFLK